MTIRDIRELMEKWSRWRRAKISAGLYWPSKSMLGRMLDGMPGVICPQCRGRDEDCEICFGEGKVRMDPSSKRINPAFIPSTYRQPDDPESERVDRIMCELRASPKTIKYFFVLWAEYVKPLGTQDVKANNMNISPGYYRVLLHRGHGFVEMGMNENVTKSREVAVTK